MTPPPLPMADVLALGLHPVALLLEPAERTVHLVNTPPNPGIPALLLTAAQRLGWRPTGRFLDGDGGRIGVLTDGLTVTMLRIAGDDGSRVVWALEGETLIPHALTSRAFAALREGALEGDGVLVCGGTAFRLISVWTGHEAVADLVEVLAA